MIANLIGGILVLWFAINLSSWTLADDLGLDWHYAVMISSAAWLIFIIIAITIIPILFYKKDDKE